MRNSLAARSLRFAASLVLGLLVGRTGLAVDAPSYARHVEQWGIQELILRSAPGHLLWWSVGGELVGEAPARLRFLRRIMLEAPYTEMEPASGLVNDGTPLVVALLSLVPITCFTSLKPRRLPTGISGLSLPPRRQIPSR